MLSLNLLPWRLEQHQKAFRRFMWQGLIWLACSVLIVVGLNQLNEQQGQALSHKLLIKSIRNAFKFSNYKVT